MSPRTNPSVTFLNKMISFDKKLKRTAAMNPNENTLPLARVWVLCPYVKSQAVLTLRITQTSSKSVDDTVELRCLIGVFSRRCLESYLRAIAIFDISRYTPNP